MNFFINSIYPSLEGEGILIGTPQVFVRFQGCTIGCQNCDSKYTWDFSNKYLFSFEQVVEKINFFLQKYSLEAITITGGDPLHLKNQPCVQKIITTFPNKKISIEAAGNCVVKEIFNSVDFINFDYKTPSTKVKCNINHLIKTIENYSAKMQIKSVVENEKDFFFLLKERKKIENLFKEKKVCWAITPAYNNDETLEQFIEKTKKIIKWNFENNSYFQIICQQHKLIYGTQEYDV